VSIVIPLFFNGVKIEEIQGKDCAIFISV